MAKNMGLMGAGYEALGHAVVMQAVEDWRNAAKMLRRHPESTAARAELSEVEEFLLSRRFNVFCDLDGKALLVRLRAEAGMKVAA